MADDVLSRADDPLGTSDDEPDRALAHDDFQGSRRISGGVPGRRTITITGHGSERYYPQPTRGRGRRPAQRAHERAGFRPDRMAMWAVLLGLLLVLVAATSSHAATTSHAATALRDRPGHALRVTHVSREAHLR